MGVTRKIGAATNNSKKNYKKKPGGELICKNWGEWYRQEKIIFELFSGALQENPVRAPGAVTVGALTGQGPIQETIFGELFSGALQENPVIAPGQLHEKNVYRIILVIISP